MSVAQREPTSMAQTMLEHFTTVMAGTRKALERGRRIGASSVAVAAGLLG